jgi:acyl-CoA reductase-like NAD-dependent aldehyde dehydrogenase
MREEERQRNVFRLTEAIDEDSKAIARLLTACGPSKAFEPEQATLFHELIEHRRHLLTLLQKQEVPSDTRTNRQS